MQVFSVKYLLDNFIDLYKACFVAMRFAQISGYDFIAALLLDLKLIMVCLIVSVAASYAELFRTILIISLAALYPWLFLHQAWCQECFS